MLDPQHFKIKLSRIAQVWNLPRAMDVAYLIIGSNDGTTNTTSAGDELQMVS